MNLFLMTLLLSCSPKPATAAASADPSPTACTPAGWPEAQRGQLLALQARGLELARRDAYAWQATDRLLEAVDRKPAAYTPYLPVDSWIIEEGSDSAAVYFNSLRDGHVVMQLRIDFDAAHPEGKVPAPLGKALPDDHPVARKALAFNSALADPRFVRKVSNYNLDVLPWSQDPAEGWAVYLLPGATSDQAVPLGGGYLARVSPDGREVQAMEPLSQGVLNLDLDAFRAQGGVAYGLAVLTPLPNESLFAFSSIWKLPLLVITPDGASWYIEGPKLCWMPQET